MIEEAGSRCHSCGKEQRVDAGCAAFAIRKPKFRLAVVGDIQHSLFQTEELVNLVEYEGASQIK